MAFLLSSFSGNKTVKINDKVHGSMKKRLQAEAAYPTSAVASLGTSGLQQAVKLPKGENKNEWFAVHVVDYINSVNILYGSLGERCTAAFCPQMRAGNFEYLWMDKENPKYKKPVHVSAPEYVSLLMAAVELQVNDESIFPSDPKVPFPSNFTKIVKTIFKRLFRVYAHIYCHHFDHIKSMGEDAHLNTNFKHFMYFVYEFDLIEPKDITPMNAWIVTLLGEEYKKKLVE